MYFTPITEAAIIAYNAETDGTLRNKVFNEHIHRALDKLSENIIHTFKFYYFDYGARELKQEVVAFMLEKLPKFQEGKGKAFSYFSIVAKNYLIQNKLNPKDNQLPNPLLSNSFQSTRPDNP